MIAEGGWRLKIKKTTAKNMRNSFNVILLCSHPWRYTVKKGLRFSSPQPGCHLGTKLSLAGNNGIIPGQGKLVCDIPAGDGKIFKLFYSVIVTEKMTPIYCIQPHCGFIKRIFTREIYITGTKNKTNNITITRGHRQVQPNS